MRYHPPEQSQVLTLAVSTFYVTPKTPGRQARAFLVTQGIC